ncbi:AbiV family abortive infection protein [Kitasatospora sp. NPDC004669]|uniref:AbiV family abortive infection protein n=1 Tax=Kitasatospora sp. NPDC004669 TaxID=3154555 RepID=UPI0033BB8226
MTRPIPPVPEILRIIPAVINNADELLGDARTLLDAGRVPRAYSLAVLALEEFGKANLCISAIGANPDAKDFWKAWRLHPSKLFETLGMQSLGSPLDGQSVVNRFTAIKAAANDTHGLKLSGLYVDYDETGQLQLPQAITREEAEAVIAEATDVSGTYQMWLVPGATEALLTYATPEMLAAVRQAAEHAARTDIEGGFERARELYARGTGQPYVPGDVTPSPNPLPRAAEQLGEDSDADAID